MLDEPFVRAVTKLDALHGDLEDARRVQLLCWLSTIPCHLHHDNFVKNLVHDLGRWLLSSQEYLGWKLSSSSEAFWLHGIPGCGKTRLVAKVVKELQLERENFPNPAPLAYFYCSRDSAEPERANPGDILRAIVKQLSYTTIGGPTFRPTREKFEQSLKTASLHGLLPDPLDVGECTSLIVELGSVSPLTIVIDAIDECYPVRRHILLTTLEDIIARSENVVKVFVSSREDGDIYARFNMVTNLRVTPVKNSNDITIFVETRVHEAIRQGRLVPDVNEQMVITSLKHKAQGM